jgi:threonine synthase
MKGTTVEPSISPSMDIQISSNFERYLFDLLGRDAKKLSAVMKEYKETGKFSLPDDLMKQARAEFSAFRADDAKTLATIKQVFTETGYTLDPHTAVGMSAAIEIARTTDAPVVGLACAHPAKFPDAVEKATGKRPPLPPHLADLFSRPEKLDVLPNSLEKIEEYVRRHSK